MTNRKADKRRKYDTRTEGAIREALMKLLSAKPLVDITISELALKAGVSRSTFYDHYRNVGDVYDELMDDFGSRVSPLMEQVACSDGFRPTGRPFCELVRDGDEFGPIVEEDRFLPSFLARQDNLHGHDLHGILTKAGYTDRQAQALCAFQLSGCFSAARSIQADDDEWRDIRSVIDRFILGGLAACLAARGKQANGKP